jgi:L-ascorbate metabolism protein UlaG (beta-lactamase superfamily)
VLPAEPASCARHFHRVAVDTGGDAGATGHWEEIDMTKQFSIQYFGYSCFLITSLEGVRILLDPYFDGNEDAGMSAAAVDNIDIIAPSHGAVDHMGDAIPIAMRTHATLFCGPDIAHYAAGKGLGTDNIRMMVWGTRRLHKGIEIRSLEARHLSSFDCGSQIITGLPMSFIVRMEDGSGIYFSGDTSIFGDLKLFGELYPIRIGLMGMSGLPGMAYEMDGPEAALAAKWLGVTTAIPFHYPAGSPEPIRFKETLAAYDPPIETIVLRPREVYRSA